MDRKLYRSNTDKVLAGVCGGLGEYFGIDPVIVRLAFVVVVFAGGAGLLGYVIAWIIIPRRPYGMETQTQSNGGIDTGNAKPNQTMSFSATATWTRYLPGLILVCVGAVLLIRQTLYWFSWREFLPIALIILGVIVIVRSIGWEKKSGDQYQQHV